MDLEYQIMDEFPLTWAEALVGFLEDEYGIYTYADYDGDDQYVEIPINPGFIEVDRYRSGWTLSYLDVFGNPSEISSFEELKDLVYSEYTRLKE
jgi:hypothetical protein